MSKEAVEWLEALPIHAVNAYATYVAAGDSAPVYHTRLFTIKTDHETQYDPTDDRTCHVCKYAVLRGDLIVIE